MKVTVKLAKNIRSGMCCIKEIRHKGIRSVLWEDDWVRLVPLAAKVKQISYRKDLVFAVIEEEE